MFQRSLNVNILYFLSRETIGTATPDKKNKEKETNIKVKGKEFQKHYPRHLSHKITITQGATLYKSKRKMKMLN